MKSYINILLLFIGLYVSVIKVSYTKEISAETQSKIELYKYRIANDNSTAYFFLGRMYEFGDGVKIDYNTAFEFYKSGADLGDLESQGRLGYMYQNGKGVKKDINKALELYKSASDKGYAVAKAQLGYMYQNGQGVKKDFNKAFEFYKSASDKSYDYAQSQLAYMYGTGQGVKKDFNKAFKLYKLASDQGNAYAKAQLAYMYQNGQGVKKDFNKAFELYKLASNQGNAYAQERLGYMYEFGEGVKKDINKALDFYELAAAQGDDVGQHRLGFHYSRQAKLMKDNSELKEYEKILYKKAINFYKLSADQGFAPSQANLGLIYFNGILVKKDLKEAIRLFKLAAHQRDMSGQNNLAMAYEGGCGVKKNLKEAIRLFKLAAKQGQVQSLISLGKKYSNGNGMPKNFNKAFDFFTRAGQHSVALEGIGTLYKVGGEKFNTNFKKAIEHYNQSIKTHNKNSKALYHLGEMYFNGIGFKKRNITKAIELFTLSAEIGNSEAAEKLSEIYELGIGVDKNNTKALYWIQKIKKISICEIKEWEENFNINAIQASKYANLKNKIAQSRLSNKGKFYAVMIGVSKYENFTSLKTPLKDIEVIGNVLKTKYGFELINLENPTQRNITDKLFEIEKRLTKNDSLLIYFAGHGKVKNKNDGYWIPKDGHKEDEGTWISNDYIRNKLKSIKANNILVIADSCYSGTLGMRGGKVDDKEQKSQNYYLNTKSRIAITSGANQPVLDGGGGDHSIFARLLINKLKNNNKAMTTSQLHGSISSEVREITEKLNVKQTPVRIPLYGAGHVEPDFVFIPK